MLEQKIEQSQLNFQQSYLPLKTCAMPSEGKVGGDDDDDEWF